MIPDRMVGDLLLVHNSVNGFYKVDGWLCYYMVTANHNNTTGGNNMKNMSINQRVKCHAIIHAASTATGAVGAGLAQIPCSDNAVITPIQLGMTIALGRVFGVELSESAAIAATVSFAGAAVGRTASQALIGWIPGVGNVINACTAVSITETMGWLMAKDFSRQSVYA